MRAGVNRIATRLSVVTVVLNDRDGLARTLESIAAQVVKGPTAIQSIIVDGGSADGSKELAERLRLPGSILVSGPDDGIYDAMNKGVALATGDVVHFLNAGDVYASPDVIRAAMDAFRESRADVVYGDIGFVDNAGNVVRYWCSGTYAKWKVFTGWAPPHPGAFARRSLYERSGLFDKALRNAGDYELFLRWFLGLSTVPHYIPVQIARMEAGGLSNGSVRGILLGAREVRYAWRKNGYRFGFLAPWAKLARKPFQLRRLPSMTWGIGEGQ